MKTITFKLSIAFVLLVPVLFWTIPGHTADSVSSRDLSVDAAFLPDGAQGGVLPATGSQTLASGTPVRPMPSGLGVSTSSTRGVTDAYGGTSRADNKARIYEAIGKVKIAKQGSSDWKKVKIDTIVEEGDVILTGKNGKASITFDEAYLNITHIPENTRAVFKTIEPTDIFLEDGTVFNLFDAVPTGSNWKVSTPTAVAAVRGTYWLVNFTASTGEIITATFDVPDDGSSSLVQLIDILASGQQGPTVNIPEGNQISLAQGQSPDPSLLTGVDPQWLAQIQATLELLAFLRSGFNSGSQLPPTSGEFFTPGTLGFDGLGSGGGQLDPQLDTGSILNDPPSLGDEESGGSPPPAGGEGDGGGFGRGGDNGGECEGECYFDE